MQIVYSVISRETTALPCFCSYDSEIGGPRDEEACNALKNIEHRLVFRLWRRVWHGSG
jgi:hypothetical protein